MTAYAPLIGRLIEMIINLLARRKKVRELVLPLIQKAAIDGQLPDNKARRDWVVGVLIKDYELSESTARLLVEAGLKLWKKLEEKRLKKEAKEAKENP